MTEPTIKDVMELLSRAQDADFEVWVTQEFFQVLNEDDVNEGYNLYYPFNMDECLCIQRAVESKEARIREVQEKYALQQQALSKLTKEERIALGIDV